MLPIAGEGLVFPAHFVPSQSAQTFEAAFKNTEKIYPPTTPHVITRNTWPCVPVLDSKQAPRSSQDMKIGPKG